MDNSQENKQQEDLLEILYEGAVDLFYKNEYEEAVKRWKGCYEAGNEDRRNSVKQTIYNVFINPNEKEFQKNYEIQKEIISKKNNLIDIPYDNLKLDFIYVSDDRYYIFNKVSEKFEGILDLTEKNIELKRYKEDEYNAAFIVVNHNIEEIFDLLVQFANRSLYLVINNKECFYSMLKIPNFAEKVLSKGVLFSNIEEAYSYLNGKEEVYLPKIVYAFDDKLYQEILSKIQEMYKKRIEHKNSKRENILLSICIISYNEGEYLYNKVNRLLKIQYDNEIEIVVLNNGSISDIEGYTKVKQIKDSRVSYLEVEEKQNFAQSFCNILLQTKGKYAIILEGKDEIEECNLHHYFKIFEENSNLGIVLASAEGKYRIRKYKYCKAGTENFFKSFLVLNCISGILYNMNNIKRKDLITYIQANSDKEIFYHYPHMCLATLLSEEFDYCEDSQTLIVIDRFTEKNKDTELAEQFSCPEYSTYESRIKQMYDWVEIINNICILTNEDKNKAFRKICQKTYYLLRMVKSIYKEDWEEICEKTKQECINAFKNLKISDDKYEERFQDILKDINEICKEYK